MRSNALTTAPDGNTSILRAPPVMSFTFLAKSRANSWKMSLAGQVLWKRQVMVSCALTICGAESAEAPTTVAAPAFRNSRRERFTAASFLREREVRIFDIVAISSVALIFDAG